MDETLREFFLCICTIADRLSAVSIRIFSAGLDKNGCLDYNEFIFELNIWCLYNTHISFGRYITDCGERPRAVFCICFSFLIHNPKSRNRKVAKMTTE